MDNLNEIIAVAKTKEDWSVNHKWNYGPIEYLKEHIVSNDANTKFADFEKSYDKFWDNVHRVTDAETYFVYEHKSFDIYVDERRMVCIMRRTFPGVSINQVLKWLRKHTESHQIIVSPF